VGSREEGSSKKGDTRGQRTYGADAAEAGVDLQRADWESPPLRTRSKSHRESLLPERRYGEKI
jgi:hypothetical protein